MPWRDGAALAFAAAALTIEPVHVDPKAWLAKWLVGFLQAAA